ncbi:unnamed protein product [Polarella glacialis]|uniref:Uncharacterized protein n=1 Tax=Polarella glacialis TaxID=89957 RepID=A0A813JBJ6_POLGL|nr:unnamed protein product [Polarella glacialis]
MSSSLHLFAVHGEAAFSADLLPIPEDAQKIRATSVGNFGAREQLTTLAMFRADDTSHVADAEHSRDSVGRFPSLSEFHCFTPSPIQRWLYLSAATSGSCWRTQIPMQLHASGALEQLRSRAASRAAQFSPGPDSQLARASPDFLASARGSPPPCRASPDMSEEAFGGLLGAGSPSRGQAVVPLELSDEFSGSSTAPHQMQLPKARRFQDPRKRRFGPVAVPGSSSASMEPTSPSGGRGKLVQTASLSFAGDRRGLSGALQAADDAYAARELSLQSGGSSSSVSAYVSKDFRCRSSLPEEPSGISFTSRQASTLAALELAANLVGEKARGPVALAIRAKAVCRLTVQSASRRLCRLALEQAMGGATDALAADGNTKAKVEVIDRMHCDELLELLEVNDLEKNLASTGSCGPEEARWSFTAADMSREPSVRAERPSFSGSSGLHGQDDALVTAVLCSNGGFSLARVKRRRRIEVLQNTTLGKMVLADPELALRHALVAVPSWYHNKPWPPPPLREFTVRNLRSDDSSSDESEKKARKKGEALLTQAKENKEKKENGHPKLDRKDTQQLEKRFTLAKSAHGNGKRHSHAGEIQDIFEPLAVSRKDLIKQRRSEQPIPGDLLAEQEIALLDFKSLLKKMSQSRRVLYTNAFQRHSQLTPGFLRAEALQRAMVDLRLMPKSAHEKLRLHKVQKKVLLLSRSIESEDEEDSCDGGQMPDGSFLLANPLRHPLQGGWTLDEYLTMAASAKELSNRDQDGANKEVADKLKLPLSHVRDLHGLWERFSPKKGGIMTVKELACLLALVDIRRPSTEDVMLLLDEKSFDLTFRIPLIKFISVMKKIEDVLGELAKARMQASVLAVVEQEVEHDY